MDRGVPIRSVSRSISVLQTINRSGSMTLMEIARSVSLPYPTTFRIIHTLMHEGLIECDPERKHYRPTELVQSLSRGYSDDGCLLAAARPRMVGLTQKLSWPISLTTHVGRSMMVRDSTHTLTSLTFCNYAPGFALPVLGCASGHVYVAHLSDGDRASLLASFEAFERRSEMLQMLKNDRLVRNIRDSGYATSERNPHTSFPGKTSSIAVPVFRDGQVIAAMTLIFFASAMPMSEAVQRYAEALKAAARKISGTLATAPARAAPEPAPASASAAELVH